MVGTFSITDMYMSVLTSLDDKDKLELISKLSDSMRKEVSPKRTRPDLRTCFSGDWSDLNANELRNHRYHGRTVESW